LTDKICIEQQINLQLTSKISLELDSNSSLLFEYGQKLVKKVKHVTENDFHELILRRDC